METPEQKLKRLEALRAMLDKEIEQARNEIPMKVGAFITHLSIKPRDYNNLFRCEQEYRRTPEPIYMDVDVIGALIIGSAKLEFKAQGILDHCTERQLHALTYSRGLDVTVTRKP